MGPDRVGVSGKIRGLSSMAKKGLVPREACLKSGATILWGETNGGWGLPVRPGRERGGKCRSGGSRGRSSCPWEFSRSALQFHRIRLGYLASCLAPPPKRATVYWRAAGSSTCLTGQVFSRPALGAGAAVKLKQDLVLLPCGRVSGRKPALPLLCNIRCEVCALSSSGGALGRQWQGLRGDILLVSTDISPLWTPPHPLLLPALHACLDFFIKQLINTVIVIIKPGPGTIGQAARSDSIMYAVLSERFL